MFCSHSSPVNEVSLSVSSLGTESLDLSTIPHAKVASHELKRNKDNFERKLPVSSLRGNSIISDGLEFDESVNIKAGEAIQMGRLKKKLRHSVSDQVSSDKENVQVEKIKMKHNSLNQQNSDITEKPSMVIKGSLCFDDQLNESCLDKHTISSLQELSIFNDFSPSVRAMLTELGLKPPSNRISAMESRSKISMFDLAGEIPKPLPLQENKILMNKLEKVGSFVPSILASLSTGQEFKSSDYNRVKHQVQEELEKERFRRKHYEHVIEDLQQKVLTIGQELALVSSLNEKKSSTIKELVQTLENLAIAWQKLEGSQMKMLKETEVERDNLRIQLEASTKQTNTLKKDLEETRGNLSDQKIKLLKEQEQHEEEVKNLNSKKHNLEEELSASKMSLQRELMFGEELKKEILKLQKLLQEEQMLLLQKASDFDNFKHVIENQLSAEVQKREEKGMKLDEMAFKLEAANVEMFSLKEQLDIERKEKDVIETELRRRESEFISDELKYRTEMACQVKEIEVRAEEQSKHLEEALNKKHQEEISHVLSEHRQWKEEEEARHLKEIQEYRNEISRKFHESQEWLKTSEIEALNLKHKIEHIERGRSQMLSQLRSFLQSMWRNSFQLFYGTCDQDSELFKEEHRFEEYLPLTSAPAKAEFLSIPTNTKKYFPVSLPLNLTSDFNINHECSIENDSGYDASVRETRQFGNVSFNKKHLGTPIISSKSDEKYLINDENLFLHRERPYYYDSTGQVTYGHLAKVLPADSQMQRSSEEKYNDLSEQTSSIDCCNCNKSQKKVLSPPDILCPTINSANDMIIDCHPSQKMKNSVRFMVPCKDSDGRSNYSEEENRPCSDGYSQQNSSSTEMTKLPSLTKNTKHSPLMIHKMYYHQLPAEKLEAYSNPLKKEVVNVDPVFYTQSDIAPDKMEEQTSKDKVQNEPVALQRKMCSSGKSEHFKDRKSAKNEFLSNYPVKDIRAIYCPESKYDMDKCSIKTNIKDRELYNKLHPWK